MRLMTGLFLLALGVLSTSAQWAVAQEEPSPILIDDFESYEAGTFPGGWVFVTEEEEIKTYEEVTQPGETVKVVEAGDNQFVRFLIEDGIERYSQLNGEDFNWDLSRLPRLKWRWRAHHLPEGASERGENDTGAAVYVTFGTDWLGRPESIKYTYSSSLPVGTVVEFGPLKVIVVDSAVEQSGAELGSWITVRRNVINDYRQVFGGDPPERPLSITLWSDSDTTHDLAKVDFDDIELLPPTSR